MVVENWGVPPGMNRELAMKFMDSLSEDQKRMLVEGQHMDLAASLTPEQKGIAFPAVEDAITQTDSDVAVVLGLLVELVHTRAHPGCEDPKQPREATAKLLFEHTTEHMDQDRLGRAMVKIAGLLIAELVNRHGGIEEVINLLETAADAVPQNKELFLSELEW